MTQDSAEERAVRGPNDRNLTEIYNKIMLLDGKVMDIQNSRRRMYRVASQSRFKIDLDGTAPFIFPAATRIQVPPNNGTFPGLSPDDVIEFARISMRVREIVNTNANQNYITSQDLIIRDLAVPANNVGCIKFPGAGTFTVEPLSRAPGTEIESDIGYIIMPSFSPWFTFNKVYEFLFNYAPVPFDLLILLDVQMFCDICLKKTVVS